MKIKARCPASCGELLQGIIGDSEKLISYPINLHSTVTLQEVKQPSRRLTEKKAFDAMVETVSFFGESRKIIDNIEINVDSQIPVGKGMASSTADVAATIFAMAHLLGKDLPMEELARLCVKVEPTDSTIFKNITLFDHLKGYKIEEFYWSPQLDVLILEAADTVDTQEFRKKEMNHLRYRNKPQVEKAFHIFKSACVKKDASLLGKAATISSMANQRILPKEKLEMIIELSLKHGCYGVNVAHSGTVVGILLDHNKVDIEKLEYCLIENKITEYYPRVYPKKMIDGGCRIIT